MAKRLLAIGVGGTGKSILTLLKERLEESYGVVPPTVAMLAFDTDDLGRGDAFAGTRLKVGADEQGRAPEYVQVISPAGMTMDTVFRDLVRGESEGYFYWLEREKLDRILAPTERDIRGGAQQRRPIGRTAVFLRWQQIFTALNNSLAWIYGDTDAPQAGDREANERGKRQIFIVGSLAGGTGSGFLIDVANLVRHAVSLNSNLQSVDVSAAIVLPDAFRAYTSEMRDATNLNPNTYAALRELDRFTRTHSSNLPYMIRYATSENSISWSTNQLFDHTYLVDTTSRDSAGDLDLGGKPEFGVFPEVADFIAAHIDESLGNHMASLRSNAGQFYDKVEGRVYSSFNVRTYIFPVNDVIESFSYRFLREVLVTRFLMPGNRQLLSKIDQDALNDVSRIFSQAAIEGAGGPGSGRSNPGIVQRAIAATRPIDAEMTDTSWRGLFAMIALSDSSFAQDAQNIEGWLNAMRSRMVLTGEGDYRRETYPQGYDRLNGLATYFLDELIGRQTVPDDEDSRGGGVWNQTLERYREVHRDRFREALGTAIVKQLNDRDGRGLLGESRLPAVLALLTNLKSRLVQFRQFLVDDYQRREIDVRINRANEEVRKALQLMYEKRGTRALLGKPEAYTTQVAFTRLFVDRMELALHQRVYRTVLDVLDALGANDPNQSAEIGVVDEARLQVEAWSQTFRDVHARLKSAEEQHDQHRVTKSRIKVREYLTDEAFEKQLYTEQLADVVPQVLGQRNGVVGIQWLMDENEGPLALRVSLAGGQAARGTEEITARLFERMVSLFGGIREKASVADRVAAKWRTPSTFGNTVNQVGEPFLRYNPSENRGQMAHERYFSIQVGAAGDSARSFFNGARDSFNKDIRIDDTSESRFACTVALIARGVRLAAIDQFKACEAEYRNKLFVGRESLHLFPEEQNATLYESRLDSIGAQRVDQAGVFQDRCLSPELVIAMGDDDLLKAFVLACAYGLIHEDTFFDASRGREDKAIYLTPDHDLNQRRLLSTIRMVEELDQHVTMLDPREQTARLYLNALQNMALKVSRRRGVADGQIATLAQLLERRAVKLDIQDPFRFAPQTLYNELRRRYEAIGPSAAPGETLDQRRSREKANAYNRLEFLVKMRDDLVANFKRSPALRVKDLGFVMHLVLQAEISVLEQRARA
jgi:hypothetical protein